MSVADWINNTAAREIESKCASGTRFAPVYKRSEDVQAFRDVIESLEREAPADEDNPQISLLDKK